MIHALRALVTASALMVSTAVMATNIIVVSHGQADDPFWSIVKNGVDQAAKVTGATVTYRAPISFDMIEMSQLIDAAVVQEPDGLIVTVPDIDALGPSITRAIEAGIPVISINAGGDAAAKLGVLLHVGLNEYDAGKIAGKKMAEMGGKVGICVNQEVGNVSLDRRCEGFGDGFGGDMTVVPSGNEPAEVSAKIQAALDSNDKIDTIIALSASLVGNRQLQLLKPLKRAIPSMLRPSICRPDF